MHLVECTFVVTELFSILTTREWKACEKGPLLLDGRMLWQRVPGGQLLFWEWNGCETIANKKTLGPVWPLVGRSKETGKETDFQHDIQSKTDTGYFENSDQWIRRWDACLQSLGGCFEGNGPGSLYIFKIKFVDESSLEPRALSRKRNSGE